MFVRSSCSHPANLCNADFQSSPQQVEETQPTFLPRDCLLLSLDDFEDSLAGVAAADHYRFQGGWPIEPTIYQCQLMLIWCGVWHVVSEMRAVCG